MWLFVTLLSQQSEVIENIWFFVTLLSQQSEVIENIGLFVTLLSQQSEITVPTEQKIRNLPPSYHSEIASRP